MERGGLLTNFFEDEPQAFCLVSVPDYQPRGREKRGNVEGSGDADVGRGRCEVLRGVRGPDVHVRDAGDVDVPAAAESRETRAVSGESRAERAVLRQTYELTVAAEDKERLKMMSDVVNESTRLCDIDLTQFRVRISANGGKNRWCRAVFRRSESDPVRDVHVQSGVHERRRRGYDGPRDYELRGGEVQAVGRVADHREGQAETAAFCDRSRRDLHRSGALLHELGVLHLGGESGDLHYGHHQDQSAE